MTTDPKRTQPTSSRSQRARNALLIGGVVVAAAAAGFAFDGDSERGSEAPIAEVRGPAVVPDNRAAINDGDALPAGHPPIDAPQGAVGDLPLGHPPLDAAPHAATPGVEAVAAVAKLQGGVDIAEIFARAAALEGKSVRLRARVAKVTPNVLGKTWLHVQDGTAEATGKSYDLVVTTDAVPIIGQTVILEGVLVRNKDLGSGYRYDVLLENARIDTQASGSAG